MILLAPELVHHADLVGETPLMDAVPRVTRYDADTGTSKRLLAAGASPFPTNKHGEGVLHMLAEELGTPGLRPLLQDLVGRGANINARNEWGETPLFRYASRCPQGPGGTYDRKKCYRGEDYELPRERGAIALLQERGADFFVRDQKGRGLLHVAAAGDAVRFQELMTLGLDPTMEDSAGQNCDRCGGCLLE